MSSAEADVAESSRAGQEAEQKPESEPQRKWVALVSAAVLLGDEDQRAKEIVDGTDVMPDVDLHLNDPPLPSYLALHRRVAPDRRRNNEPLSAYILAADRSGCILLQVVVEGNYPDLFLCDARSRRCTVTILPPVSSDIQAMGLAIRPDRSIGLIADPHQRGHYVVAQLHPTTSEGHDIAILCYSTDEGQWFTRGLTLRQDGMRKRNPFSETGVLAHDARLWWLALAHGVFFCDPCTVDDTQLRFLPLPDDCEMEGDVGFDPRIRTLSIQRRCVRPSEGKLRFVEIRGLTYDDELVDPPAAKISLRMWTLDDPEGPNPWTLEYEVAFREIWENKTYADAGLLQGEVPDVALVDPNDHYVVYFFQGSKLFGLDVREKKVVACKDFLTDRDQVRSPSSRPIVDAWELPPPPPTLSGDDDSSADADNRLGLPCRWQAFCSFCRSAICLSCCPNHVSCHHGIGLGTTISIYMTKDGAAVDAKEIRVKGMGYSWQLIQRKMDSGLKYIILRVPAEDRRNTSDCLQCAKRVKSKSRYCCVACKILHKPNGRSTHIVEALVQADFNLPAIIDGFCETCKRSFASAHCTNHEVHHH